jgi:hypothetical protein
MEDPFIISYFVSLIICLMFKWATQIFKMEYLKRDLSFLEDMPLYPFIPLVNFLAAFIIVMSTSVELLHFILHLPTHIKNLFKGKK